MATQFYPGTQVQARVILPMTPPFCVTANPSADCLHSSCRRKHMGGSHSASSAAAPPGPAVTAAHLAIAAAPTPRAGFQLNPLQAALQLPGGAVFFQHKPNDVVALPDPSLVSRVTQLCGLKCPPPAPQTVPKPWPSVLQNVTSFGIRVVAGVTCRPLPAKPVSLWRHFCPFSTAVIIFRATGSA